MRGNNMAKEQFFGKKSATGGSKLIITTSEQDAEAAIAQGFAAVAVMKTSLNNEEHGELKEITHAVQSVYIVSTKSDIDSVANVLKIGQLFGLEGKTVFIVDLTETAGGADASLEAYFTNHSAEDFKKLLTQSASLLDVLIKGLPPEFVKAQHIIASTLAPLLARADKVVAQHYVNVIAKKVKTSPKVILSTVSAAKKDRRKMKPESSDALLDPDTQLAAKAIAVDPLLLKRRIDVINEAGVVGERPAIGMYFCALDSRLLKDDATPGQNALAVKNAGHFGAGKSYSLLSCLQIYPEAAYHLLSSGSEKALYYLEDGLKHQCLVIAEAFQLQADKGDLEIAYIVRNLLSEGKIIRDVVEPNEEGALVTVVRMVEGPTSLITTTILDQLEPQLEDRLFTIHPDESVDQTKDIITMNARQLAGEAGELKEVTRNVWKAFHTMLEPVSVVMPFAIKVADHINAKASMPISTRRAFRKVMSVIQAISCSYQFQRERDGSGNLIAEMPDYWMALQIVGECFRENLGQKSIASSRRLEVIQQCGPITVKGLAAALGVSRSAVSQWLHSVEDEALVAWVKSDGTDFADDKELIKAKRAGKAFLIINGSVDAVDTAGLPSPYDLTNDASWSPGGTLYMQYDLQLGLKGAKAE
jgi:hypothetical protein